MPEIVLAINGQDCTSDDGNIAEEYEGIAITLLRAAAVRNREEGKLECFGHDGKPLAWVHLLRAVPINEDALADPPAIARFDSMREPKQLRGLSLSMLKQYRRLSTQ